MPEIGATLREARMRARIDISEIETQTKIRAKYLRALENEEWDLLPGPTYVKSFLRTYADALGLDGRRLVEEYKLDHERPSDIELLPIAPPGQRRTTRRPSGPSRAPRWFLALGLIAILVGALYLLGRGGGDGGGDRLATSTTTTPRTTTTRRTQTTPRATTPRRVRLQIVARAPVYVCLVANGDRRLVSGQVLDAGQSTPTFRSRRFTVTLGNGSADLRINGRLRTVPASSEPIGYEITPGRGRQPLPPDRRPTCGA